MDPRDKREDETWAEYGARMASMGIAPTESYFAGPTVNQFRPTGSDYTPQQLSTPIHQLQQQNIPQNVVPITPVDPTLAGMGTVGLSMIQEQVIPKTGHFGISQDYSDFSPHMGALVDMVGNQPPAIDYGVVTDNPTRPYEPGIPFHQNMPTVTPSDQNIMPTIQGVSPQGSGMVPIGYTETTDSGEVVPMTNENLSFFGAAPVPTSPSMNVDYSQALADAGMATVPIQSEAPETPAAYTGELDRYGLSGWTPEVPDPRHPVDFWGKGVDYVGDLISDTFDNPTLDKIYDVITWKPTLPTGILDKPMMDRLKKEAIIEKAKTAPKGNLERIAAQREEQAAAAAAARRDEQQANRRAVQRKAMEERKAAAAQRKADLAAQKAAAKAKRDLDKLKAKQTAADKNRIAAAAQEATRRSLEKQMQGWLGRDERDESAMAQIQAALDHIADLQGTGVTSGSTGDRSGEVRDAMRSVGYGGPEWT